MGSLILIFTVIAATTIPINDVYSKPLTENDVGQVLQSLQELIKQEQSNKQTRDHDERVDVDEDDTYSYRYGSLKNYRIQDQLYRSRGAKHRQAEKVQHRSKYHDLSDDHLNQHILEQLLNNNQHRSDKQNQYRAKPKSKKQRHLPNDLLASLSLGNDRQNQLDLVHNDDRRLDLGDLSDYSKVYVILNSEAIRNSKNKSKLNSFLSNLLVESADNPRAEKKDRRYKGFVLKDFEARRAARDSEMSDNDYKPKRSRGERGGGGGGGRTAIPYIRHRGDIYEKGE